MIAHELQTSFKEKSYKKEFNTEIFDRLYKLRATNQIHNYIAAAHDLYTATIRKQMIKNGYDFKIFDEDFKQDVFLLLHEVLDPNVVKPFKFKTNYSEHKYSDISMIPKYFSRHLTSTIASRVARRYARQLQAGKLVNQYAHIDNTASLDDLLQTISIMDTNITDTIDAVDDILTLQAVLTTSQFKFLTDYIAGTRKYDSRSILKIREAFLATDIRTLDIKAIENHLTDTLQKQYSVIQTIHSSCKSSL